MNVYIDDASVDVQSHDDINVSVDTTGTEVVCDDSLDLTVAKKEYSIVGDAFYMQHDDSAIPSWIIDKITEAASNLSSDSISDINTAIASINAAINALEVAENTYTSSIVTNEDIDNRVVATLDTLNVTNDILQAEANIADLASTRITLDEASSLIATALDSSLLDGDIRAELTSLQNTITTLNDSMTTSIDSLTSTMNDNTASIMDTQTTHTTEISSLATQTTNIEAFLNGDGTSTYGGSTSLENSINVTARSVESKFAYNSTIAVDGVSYNSGFGLRSYAGAPGSGTDADPYESEFWINASKFKFTNDNQTGATSVFSIDATGTQPEVTFNGKVTFGSGQTGTVSEAVSAIIETTVVGDKNINITDNLIPTDSLVGDIEHAGYQFIGDPVKSIAVGADTFVEPQIVLDADDEVYSPYVDDMTMPYYFRYAFKGNHTGMVVELSGPEGSMTATNVPITYTLVPGQTIDANTWYIIDGLIHPTGGTNHISGSIKRASDKYKIADVNDIVLNSATVWMTLGWLGATTISRMKLAIVTADTITTDFIDAEYVQDALDTIDLSGYIQSSEINQVLADDTTIIDGSRIVTGTIDGALANITNINASSITSGVIYNTGGSASSYNMKIDLDAGEIHIR